MPQQSVLAISDIDLGLENRLQNREFRKEWFRAELEDSVPATYKALRERRGITQAALAQLVGTKQSGISRFEQSDEAVWEFDFLLRMAEALDARLKLVVEAAEDVVGDYGEVVGDDALTLASLRFEPLGQDTSNRSVITALGKWNETRKRGAEPRDLSGDLTRGSNDPILAGNVIERSGQIQLSNLPG